MMFTLITIYWSAMDGHSKREVLEIFNMDKKIYQIFTIFSKLVTWHIMWLTFIFVCNFEFYPFLSLNSYFFYSITWVYHNFDDISYVSVRDLELKTYTLKQLIGGFFQIGHLKKKRTFHASGFCFHEHIRAFVICVIYVCYLGLLNLNLKEITRWVWS